MPWKNGTGVTAEVATGPAGADMDAFRWRVAVADLPASGPFSSFPGIDRTLYLLPGPPVTLVVDGHATDLDGLDAVDFAGEAATEVIVEEGPTRDLNAMSRRGVATVEHRVVHVAAPTAVDRRSGDALLYVARGTVVVDGVDIARGETALWRDAARGAVRLEPGPGGPASIVWFGFAT
jgi:environmental stress-induced protein Ves